MKYKITEITTKPIYSKILCKDNSSFFKDWYWICYECKTLYSPEEEVILKEHKGSKNLKCPKCKGLLQGAEKDVFEDRYNLVKE